jgi:hypothetical protein
MRIVSDRRLWQVLDQDGLGLYEIVSYKDESSRTIGRQGP